MVVAEEEEEEEDKGEDGVSNNTSGGVGVARMYVIKLLTRSRFFGR